MKTHQTIELGQGATYSINEYVVYEHSTHERSSVLAGQPRRVFLDCYPTIAEAQKGYPKAEVLECTSYREMNLTYLPGEEL